MPLTLRWVGEDEYDKVGEARLRAYAGASGELPQWIERVRADRVGGAGDHLLVQRGGEVVGTATQIPMHMWVRGGRVACQGVAYVGTSRTARRKRGDEE